MQFANADSDTVIAGFERIREEIAGLVEDIRAEAGRPVRERSPEVVPPLRQRASRLMREVSFLANNTGQAISRIQRDEAGDETFAPQQDPRIRTLQDIQSHALYWRSRFEPVMACFERQITGASTPLYDPEPEADSASRTLFDILDHTVISFDFMANPNAQSEVAREMGCFPDIRLKPREFAQHTLSAYRVALTQGLYNRARFLDVGCGGGGKVMMASKVFKAADGVEIDPGYARAAAELVIASDLPNSRIYEANALTFEGYADYDVVYFFQPMRNTDMLMELERVIASSVRSGTILIAPYLQFRSRAEDLGCGHVAGHIYLAGTSTDEAEAVGADAERMGARILKEVPIGAWGGVWRPALQAFAANGFALH